MLLILEGRAILGPTLGSMSVASRPGALLTELVLAHCAGASLSEPRGPQGMLETQGEGTCAAEQTFPVALRKQVPCLGTRGSVQLSKPSPRHCSKGWPVCGPQRNRVKRFRAAAPRERGAAQLCKPSPQHSPNQTPCQGTRGSVQHTKPSPKH